MTNPCEPVAVLETLEGPSNGRGQLARCKPLARREAVQQKRAVSEYSMWNVITALDAIAVNVREGDIVRRKANVVKPVWDCTCCINEEDHRRKNDPFRRMTALELELFGFIMLMTFLLAGRFALSQVVYWAGWVTERVGDMLH
ncbi:hypothetical protein FA13DRAFT_1822537 [Coprinellus micaceus]|uniref:Uncharacterized protein n=1 Tax=Coprinellus micaceus TaxID=71717 RepID=A0A4Y7S8V6_COPMI|nr:hypothetical protein FA13DRAFT_1822537 [Coprinellus micaceus]